VEKLFLMKILKTIIIIAVFSTASILYASDSPEKSFYLSIIGMGGSSKTSNFENWKIERAERYFAETKAIPAYSSSTPSISEKNESNSVWGIKYDSAFFYGNIGAGLSALVNYSSLNYGETSDYEIKDNNGKKVAGISGSPDFWIISPSFYYMFELEPSSYGGRRFLRLGAGPDFIKINYALEIRKYNHNDLPDTNPYEHTYTAKTIGWHIDLAYILNYDYWAITGELNYTHSKAQLFKDDKTGEIMRFTDGRKVTTTMRCFTFNIGAGVRVSWK
jgi:hypothetical protein